MATVSRDTDSSPGAISSVEPLMALLGAVLLLSTVPTVTKYVFQHSNVDPLGMALIRVMTGFLFLIAITLVQDRRGLSALTARDVLQLTLLGGLGVGSYVIAACGLRLTSVTHYILIYSLLSPITALFSVALKKSRGSPLKMIGIVISLFGGAIAMLERLEHFKAEFGLGDLLILFFTVMMAAHLVWSSNIVKRYGAMTANTVMFGSSALLLLLGGINLDKPTNRESLNTNCHFRTVYRHRDGLRFPAAFSRAPNDLPRYCCRVSELDSRMRDSVCAFLFR